MASPMILKIDVDTIRKALPASTFATWIAKISLFINISYFISDFNHRLKLQSGF